MTRVISGATLLVGVGCAVWFFRPFYLLVLAEIVALVAFVEYAALVDRLGARVPRIAAGTATLVTCAAVATPGAPLDAVIATVFIALAGLALASGGGAEVVHRLGAALLAAVYIGVPLGALVAVRVTAGREAVLLLLVTIVLSDTAQYYTGRLVGRRPLAPGISPKKTIEGAMGGLALGVIGMALIGRWWLPGAPPALVALVGAVVVALGIGGDLFESLLKRSAGVKDSSALIPGHGGALDRLDALLFASPVYYVFVRYAITKQ